MSESDNWQPPTPPTFSGEITSPFQQEERAGFWLRFLAHLCDGLNSLIVVLPFQIVANLFTDSNSGTADLMSLLGTVASIYVLAYWTGSRGGSPLRVRLGVLVLDENDGSFIGTKRAVYRGLMSYVSQIVLLLGYFSMLWNPNKQTWHDRVARSVVVKR